MMILQEQVTLDEAMIDGFKTYRNGCNFKLVTKSDGSHHLEYGCYCLVNLLTGNAKLLQVFLLSVEPIEKLRNLTDGISHPRRRIDGLVSPKTISELMKYEPCSCCGGFIFEQQTTEPPAQQAHSQPLQQ